MLRCHESLARLCMSRHVWQCAVSDNSCCLLKVPVDICVPPEKRAVIITGPNTGGKTAALKVGITVSTATTRLQALCHGEHTSCCLIAGF